MSEEGITVRVSASLPEKMPMSNIDAVSLVTNLLDNAEEACRKTKAPSITIKMQPVKGFLQMIFENTTIPNQTVYDSPLKTDKENPQEHGLGMNIIRDIITRIHGTIHYHAENGIFCVRILLPLAGA